MKKSSSILAASTIVLTFLASSNAENFVELWQIGADNNSQGEFGQEGGGPTAAPGSATLKDDDYYFGGIYPNPIGAVAADEPESDFERALLTVDPRVRIHFNLAEINVDPAARLRLVVDICCSNHGGDVGDPPNTGPISFAGLFNDIEILTGATSGTDNGEETFTSAAFTAGDVSAVTGENIITIERPETGGGNWMQFDYVRLEVDTDSLACTEPICSFAADRLLIQAGESATLNWVTDATASLEIDNGIGSVPAGSGNTVVSPTQNTTYTLTSTRGGDVETANVTVEVANIIDFTSADVEVTPGTQTTLSWTIDPAASVSIDQGIGNVDAQTVDGVGSIDVTPAAPETTYTLTSTRGADVATASVTVGANNFACLWQVGEANGNSSDFVQEDATSNPPPGDPVNKDDDWYFAGVYPDPIGVLAADEPLTDPANIQGFERALLVIDPTNRIHFNLDDANAFPTTKMRLTVATATSSLEEFQGFMGPIDFTASYNGNEVFNSSVTGSQLELHQGTFTAGDVGATTGDNVIEISRRTDAGGAWMLFDYIKLETEPGAQEALRITDITYDDETGDVTVTWVSRIDQRYIIETSTDLAIAEGFWGDFNDSFLATSELSSETIPAGSFALPEGTRRFFVRVREGE